MKTFTNSGNTYYVKVDTQSATTYSPTIGDIIVPLVAGVNRAQSLDYPYNPESALLLLDLYSYGIEWDNASSTNSACTRIGNPLLHKSCPIQNSFRGCIAQGGVIQYYLDATDWSKKEDGTAARTDGYDGEVKISTPRFYGKSGVDNNKSWVRVSLYRIDDTWTEIPPLLISAYLPTILRSVPSNFGYMSTLPVNSLVSIANNATWCRGGDNSTAYDGDLYKSTLGKPATAITIANFHNYAKLSGNEMMTYDYYKWIFCWLYTIEYANFNSLLDYNANLTSDGYKLGGLGAYHSEIAWDKFNDYRPVVPNGCMNKYGNRTAAENITVGTSMIFKSRKWHGFENIYYHLWLLIDGIMFKRDTANVAQSAYIFKSGHHNNQTSNATSANCRIVDNMATADGWIQNFKLGTQGDIIPSASGTNRVQDYYWCNANSTAWRLLLVGGTLSYGSSAGLFAFYSHIGVGGGSRSWSALLFARLAGRK